MAPLLALITAAAMIWHGSYAAFSASTTNPTNNWSTGTVVISDDDSGAAMFSVTGAAPGASGSRCIEVTYAGTVSAAVRLYATGKSSTNSLDTWINWTVQQGSGASYGGGCGAFVADAGAANTYTGTFADFAVQHTSHANGFGSFAPTGASTVSKSYRITYTVDASAPNSVQGSSASMGLTWEAIS